MKAHELAKQLLECENVEVIASIDISTGQLDANRRCFGDYCAGVNYLARLVSPERKEIVILFESVPPELEITNYNNG